MDTSALKKLTQIEKTLTDLRLDNEGGSDIEKIWAAHYLRVASAALAYAQVCYTDKPGLSGSILAPVFDDFVKKDRPKEEY